jgi:hypothetical protein
MPECSILGPKPLLVLKSAANRFRAKMRSATIDASVSRFSYRFNPNQVFGTYTQHLPSEVLAVSLSSIRAVASFAADASRRTMIKASARSRRRCGARRGNSASRSIRRAVLKAAST